MSEALANGSVSTNNLRQRYDGLGPNIRVVSAQEVGLLGRKSTRAARGSGPPKYALSERFCNALPIGKISFSANTSRFVDDREGLETAVAVMASAGKLGLESILEAKRARILAVYWQVAR